MFFAGATAAVALRGASQSALDPGPYPYKQMVQFLGWSVGEGELTANPWEAVQVKTGPRFIPMGCKLYTSEYLSKYQRQGAAQRTLVRLADRHALWGDLWTDGGGHHSKGQPGALH
jgi:hypothetical protein